MVNPGKAQERSIKIPLIGFGCKTVTHMAHPVPAWACKVCVTVCGIY